jgi:hypothetical protein
MTIWQFYGRVLRLIASGVRTRTFATSFVLTVATAAACALGYKVILNVGTDVISVSCIAIAIGWGVLQAPYELYAAESGRADQLEAENTRLREQLDGSKTRQRAADALADLLFDGAALRGQLLLNAIGYGEFVAAYFEWLTRAEDVTADVLSAAEANAFRALPPPHSGERHGTGVFGALERRLRWLEEAARAYVGWKHQAAAA